MTTGMPIRSGVASLTGRLSGDLASLAVGAEVAAEHLRGLRWRITATSARVTMWIEVDAMVWGGRFIVKSGGTVLREAFSGGTLLV